MSAASRHPGAALEPLHWLRRLAAVGGAPVLRALRLGDFPTPLERAGAFHGAEVWLKRDDLSAPRYGGNKVRKLEVLLARALDRGAKSVITFGGAGSNHALATAIAARGVGLRCVNILGPQVNSIAVRRNLLASLRTGAELVHAPWRDTPAVTARQFTRLWREDGRMPSVIPPGGSSPWGALGFVNAALEMAAQWREAAGGNPPDSVYVASGTMATCVGLAAGFALAGWGTQVAAVRVTVPPYTSMERARAMRQGIGELLRECGIALPEWDTRRFSLREEFFGGEYARHTPDSAAAVREAWERWGLRLEGTYTGKAMAALLRDARAGELREKRVVFWNTYNSHRELFEGTGDEESAWCALPEGFHRYFTEPVQELDAVL